MKLKALGLLLVLVMLASFQWGCEKKPEVIWELYEEGMTMEDVTTGDKPVIAYFTAAWCPPCYDLKKKTYNDPAVIEAANSYRRLKFDMSFKRSPRIQALHREYKVPSLPHIILMKPGQNPSEWERIRGFISAENFAARLKAFEGKSQLEVS